MKPKRLCLECGEQCSDSRAKYCCIECRSKYYSKKNAKESDPNGELECRECGFRSNGSLQVHLKMKHGLTPTQYMQKHSLGADSVYSTGLRDMLSERVVGDKNPAYQHGGKLSPFSKKFIKYESLSEDEVELSIKDVALRAATTTKRNDNLPLRVEYYTKRGYSEEDAKKALSERQATFSLEKCIEKYGTEDGHRIWSERQELWINNSKHMRSGVSMVQMQLFSSLIHVPDAMFGKPSESNLGEKVIVTSAGTFSLDYYIPSKNIAIEFYGDFWHGNPNKYAPGDIIKFPGNDVVVDDIWFKDDTRINALYDEHGIRTLIVWESDFKTNRDEVIKLCNEYIENG